MRILYKTDGTVYKALLEKDIFLYEDPYGLTLSCLTIDEVDPLNKVLCIDLVRAVGRQDSNGLGKYYVASGALMEREGWEERFDG